MAAIQRFSDHVIDYAERLSEMADAAQGKRGKAVPMRWVLLPASGAALLAAARSDYVSRHAKGVADEAKARASELPDDLLSQLRKLTEGAPASNGSRGSSTTRSTTRKRPSSRARSKAR